MGAMANRSVNRVILVGNLGRDAETKFTPSGAAATRFSVATTRRWKDQQINDWKEETNWTNVVLWRQEKLASYLIKGKQVYIEGRLQSRSYDDKEGKKVYTTEVVADDVILLGGPGNFGDDFNQERQPVQASRGYGAAAGKPVSNKAPVAEEDPFGGMGITDDDIPF